jgi:hypothetical protein
MVEKTRKDKIADFAKAFSKNILKNNKFTLEDEFSREIRLE